MVMKLLSFTEKQKNDEKPYHHYQQQQHSIQYLSDNYNINYTDLEFSIILHNQFLDEQDKFPDFDLRELSFGRYSHPPRILQEKEVVLWTPAYEHVIITTGVFNRNEELTIQTEDGRYEGVELDLLLWIEHLSPSSPVDYTIKRCAFSSKNAERFCGLSH